MAKKAKKPAGDENQEAASLPVMKIETVDIASLKPDPRNARLHNDRNLEAICASLKRFGQQKIIVVDADNIVLAGNGTLAAAKQLGWKTITINRTPLRGNEARAFALADNRTAELAEWDTEELNRQLQELSDAGIPDDVLAITDKELGALLDGDYEEAHAFAPKREKPEPEGEEATITPQWKVIVTCKSEQEQAEVIRWCEKKKLEFKAPSV